MQNNTKPDTTPPDTRARRPRRHARVLLVVLTAAVAVGLLTTEAAYAHAATPGTTSVTTGGCAVTTPTVSAINQTAYRDAQYVVYRPYIRRRSDGRVFYGQMMATNVGEAGSGYPLYTNWFHNGSFWANQNVFNSAWGFQAGVLYDVGQEIWWKQGTQWIHYDHYIAGQCYQWVWIWV